LRAVASEFGVEVLIAPAIEVGQGDLVLTFLYFDARGAGSLVRVTHWQLGPKLTPDTLAVVPELLDALLPHTLTAPLPATSVPLANAPAPGTGTPLANAPAPMTSTPRASAPPEQGSLAHTRELQAARAEHARQVMPSSVPIAPCVVVAGGVALIGAGAVTGLVMQGNAHDYRAQPVHTRAEADVAANTRQTLGTQARLANVLYGVGAGAAVLGSAWLMLELLGRGERATTSASTQLTATVTPMQLGIVLQRRDDWL
jgi:hypothetical protein